MNHEQIDAIAAVLRESPTLTEVEVRNGAGVSLRLRRPAPGASRGIASLSPAMPAAVAAEAVSSPSSIEAESRLDTIFLSATVVGIFRTLAGDAAIAAGEKVAAGQIVGHIEAMRLLNDCLAPETGIITQVLVDEGQPVEYGQLLFEIAPTL